MLRYLNSNNKEGGKEQKLKSISNFIEEQKYNLIC